MSAFLRDLVFGVTIFLLLSVLLLLGGNMPQFVYVMF